jgi:hypothetical protein
VPPTVAAGLPLPPAVVPVPPVTPVTAVTVPVVPPVLPGAPIIALIVSPGVRERPLPSREHAGFVAHRCGVTTIGPFKG